jgi:hypothetical protein
MRAQADSSRPLRCGRPAFFLAAQHQRPVLNADRQIVPLHAWQLDAYAQYFSLVDHVDARLETRRAEVAKPSIECPAGCQRIVKKFFDRTPRIA